MADVDPGRTEGLVLDDLGLLVFRCDIEVTVDSTPVASTPAGSGLAMANRL